VQDEKLNRSMIKAKAVRSIKRKGLNNLIIVKMIDMTKGKYFLENYEIKKEKELI
jgi:hypothetical protein